MDLGEFYDRVEKLIPGLRDSGHKSQADEVETAIRGGTTSGEVLDSLSVALAAVVNRVPDELRSEAEVLAAWASATLDSR